MADNIIQVNVTANKPKSVTVSSANVGTEITASSDTGRFWAQTAKNWAVSDVIVDNTDYSSKYYANKSKGYAQNAESFEAAARDIYNNFLDNSTEAIENVQGARDEAITNIETLRVEAIDSINSTKTTILNDIEFVADGEKKEIEDLIDNGKEELKESIGDVKVLTTLEIGDIGIAPLGIDETKGKRRYLNGQLIIQDQYEQFTNKVKSAVSLYPSLACTESEWQTTATMTVGGQVGKFVVDDDAGTIRLPKIIMPIQGLTDLSKLGEIVEAGLPNITGSFGTVIKQANNFNNGAFYQTKINNDQKVLGTGLSATVDTGFEASRSNPIYGNSTTVQQEQIQYPYFIQVATGAETEDNIINEIELNNPFFLGMSQYFETAPNNSSWLKSEGQWNAKAVYPTVYDWALINANNSIEGFKLVTDTYTDYDYVINTADETFRLPLLNGSEDLPSDRGINLTLGATGSTYTAPANGWASLSQISTNTNQYVMLQEETNRLTSKSLSSASGQSLNVNIPLKRGDKFITYYTAPTANGFSFIYAQGNGSLYFYVGETVQNANLVNIGRIQEHYTTKSMVDGQWVPRFEHLASSLSIESKAIKSFDLSNILPNDGYNYEVMFTITATTGSTSGNTADIGVWSDILGDTNRVATAVTRTSSTMQASASFVLPVGTQRFINVTQYHTSTCTLAFLRMEGYRRIGTNL